MNVLLIYQSMLLLIIAALLPWLTIKNSQAMKSLLLERPDMRWVFYQQGAFFQWLLVLLIFGSLWMQGLGPEAIGWTSYNHPGLWLSLLLLVLVSWLTFRFYLPGKVVRYGVQRIYAHVAHYLPADQRAYRWGVVMAITAGLCEELIYRGFVHHQLQQWLPLWAAVLLTNVVFAVTHYATGLLNMLGSFLLGLLFSGMFLFTGDLWLSMWLHALIDLLAMTLYPLANQSPKHSKPAS